LKLKFLFVVQGEGRGHMTQAISLQDILRDSGHEITAVLIGTSDLRQPPKFFYQKIKAPIYKFKSPNFILDSKNRSLKIFASILLNLVRIPIFLKELKTIHKVISATQPDRIINFYDPLIGLYYLFYRSRIPLVCIGHQYLFHHPDFKFPKGYFVKKIALKLFARITAIGAQKKLALSFYPLKNHLNKNIRVIPPLLRKEVFHQYIPPLQRGIKGDSSYFLIYLLNSGYSEPIIQWHKKHPEIVLHCFWDKQDIQATFQYDDTLTFHQIDDESFLKLMAGSSGLISTAGFESICEAMYLGKPIFMVPVEKHFEQYCNATEACKAGAGIYDDHFNIDKFIDYLPHHKNNIDQYRHWVDQAEEKVLEQI